MSDTTNSTTTPPTNPTFWNRSRIIAVTISVLPIFLICWYFSDILTYILVAWIVSLLGQPIMRFLRRFRYKRLHIPPSVAALLTLIFFVLVVGSLFWIFVPLFIQQAANLSKVDWVSVTKGLEKPITDLTNWAVSSGLLDSGKNAAEEIRHLVMQHFEFGSVGNIFNMLILSASNFSIGLVSVAFISFFFLKDQTMFMEFLATITPKNREEDTREAVRDTTTLLTRYFGGLVLQMLFVVGFLGVALSILGIKNALVIAVFAAIINVVPYLGPILGCIFAVLITISSQLDPNINFYDETMPLIIKVIVTFSFMQFINDWIIIPIIFSNRVLAHPLEIFLITLMGAKLGGIFGMVIAIPTYTVIRVIARAFFNEFKLVRKMTNSLDEVV